MQEMAAHLTRCAICRETVPVIEAMSDFLGSNRAVPCLPAEIKLNVMAAIDTTKYKQGTSLHRFVMKNWGFSLIAAGLILFFVKPSPLVSTITKLNDSVSWQIVRPVDKMGLITRAALGKIEILYNIPVNKGQAINKEDLR